MSVNDGFFAVDYQRFRTVCNMGANEAVVYLVLASGTAGDNRSCSWGAEAVENRTGMKWHTVNRHRKRLIEAGAVVVLPGSKPQTPKSDQPPLLPYRAALSEREQAAVDGLRNGGAAPNGSPAGRAAAGRAAAKGYLTLEQERDHVFGLSAGKILRRLRLMGWRITKGPGADPPSTP